MNRKRKDDIQLRLPVNVFLNSLVVEIDVKKIKRFQLDPWEKKMFSCRKKQEVK